MTTNAKVRRGLPGLAVLAEDLFGAAGRHLDLSFAHRPDRNATPAPAPVRRDGNKG
jgi:hypothetical protein